MKETEHKLDILLEKAGQANNYQFFVTFLFLIQFTCTEFFSQCLPFLERVPYVFIGDSKESVLVNHSICRKIKKSNYKIDESKLSKSIVVDFNIFCEQSKIFYLGLSLYSGMIIGACLAYLFADKIGRKKSLMTFTPLHIIFLCTFKILKPSLGNYCIYLVYLNLFFLGLFSHIIIITMIIYICEIIKQTDIPIFVILIITGIPLSSLLGTLLFNIKSLDWRDSLLIVALINFVAYIFTIFKLVGSPIFSLNNELFDTFVFDLIELGKKNGVTLTLNDFEFLNPYMPIRKRQTIYQKLMREINELNSNLINKSDENTNLEIAQLSSNSNYEILSKQTLKEDYLLLNNENNEELLKLFGKLKMKDYSPLDLLRFKKQIKNFLILSFLWGVTMLIRSGINLQSKFIQIMNEEIYWPVINYIFEIITYYIMLILFLKPKIEFHQSLVLLQIISFIIFMFILYLDLDIYNSGKIILVFSGRLCWTSMFALLFAITSIIYPIMIRTKGVGWNISFGFIGSIISNILTEFIDFKDFVYLFLIFEFFSLLLSYGLPNKIGTFILESPSNIENSKKKDKDKDNTELLDVSNTIFFEDKNEKDNSDLNERSSSFNLD